jgi:hypothetical protein
MQHPATDEAPTTRTLGAAEREWIRKQARVARALEAARRRNTGRFSRVVSASGAARPGRRVLS